MKIAISGKTYKVEIAETEEEQEKGLSKRKNLPEDAGMLFVYDEPQKVGFWMKDTWIPLDIIFLDSYGKVLAVEKGVPENEEPFIHDDVQYVLELNVNSGVKVGDELDNLDDVEEELEEELEEESEKEEVEKMVLLDDKGNEQMEMYGGERIFSRIHTKKLIKLNNEIESEDDDEGYKKLAKAIINILKEHEEQDDDYVQIKS